MISAAAVPPPLIILKGRPYLRPVRSRSPHRKAEMLIDKIQQRPMRKPARQVFAKEVGHVVDACGALSADVRRDDAIGQFPQRTGRRQWLNFGDVKTRAS